MPWKAPKKGIVVGHGTEAVRGFCLVVGGKYVIQSLNPKKRNREILLLEICDEKNGGLVRGIWLGNGRLAKIDPQDLVPNSRNLLLTESDIEEFTNKH